MTEQEAEVLIARLTRIWGPVTHIHNFGGLHTDKVSYQGQITPEVRFTYYPSIAQKGDYCFSLSLDVPNHGGTRRTGRIYCYSLVSDIHSQVPRRFAVNKKLVAEYAQFAAQWLPFFRRCCFLSGANIEASAHEKLEWIQGFSREEIETWNLNF